MPPYFIGLPQRFTSLEHSFELRKRGDFGSAETARHRAHRRSLLFLGTAIFCAFGPAIGTLHATTAPQSNESSSNLVRFEAPAAETTLVDQIDNQLDEGFRQQDLHRYEAVQPHMGVRFRLVIYASSDEQAEKAISAAFAEIERMNRIFSDYDPDSELSRLADQSKAGQWIDVSPGFWQLIKLAESVSHDSRGAFDVTLGPLTKLWRRSRRDGQLPDRSILQAAIKRTGYQQLEIDSENPRVKLKQDGMQLDAGGIAKGFAADQALRVLNTHGIESALVDASGDITLGAAPPGEPGWNVGIAPLDAKTPVSRKVILERCAVATSGDAWQAIEIEGQRYSHIIDPQTGLGLQQRSSVTVIAPTGALADAWASAVSVLGPEVGVQIINEHPDLQTWIVTLVDGKPIVSTSKNFPQTTPIDRD